MAFILDASMSLAWCFPDEATAYTQSVLTLLRNTEATVPAIWPLEVTNALIIGERRQRVTPAQTVRFVNVLRSLPIMVREGDVSRSLVVIRALAIEHGLSAYDASYLDLAMELGLPLATVDARLSAAATRVGVPLVQ